MKGVLVERGKNTGKRNYYLDQEWDEKTAYKKRDQINCLRINNKNSHGDSNTFRANNRSFKINKKVIDMLAKKNGQK